MSSDMNDRLVAMLRQVDPSLNASGLRESLEGQRAVAPGTGLESQIPQIAEAELAQESLDSLRRGDVLDEDGRFGLEAVVMPYFRPVVDIVGNAITLPQLTNKWNHLGQGATKARIEKTFLSIGRIEIPQHPSLPYAGTGFVVGRAAGDKHLLMTNRHVAELFARGLGARNLRFIAGQTAEVDFFREHGSASTERLRVERVVMIHPYWDMALVEVSGLPATREPLELLAEEPSGLKDREVVAVGYPGYDPTGDAVYQQTLARVFRGIYYVKRMQPGLYRIREQVPSFAHEVPAITHDCSTLGGNSGSAVIDVATGKVVGLHFAGQYLHANYAVSPYDLAQDSRVVDTGIRFSRTVTLSTTYVPYWQAADRDGNETVLLNPPVIAAGTNASSPADSTSISAPVLTTDSRIPLTPGSIATPAAAVRVEIPLKVAITIDGSKAMPIVTLAPETRAAETEEVAADVEEATAGGFDAEFLSTSVPPPRLRQVDLNDAVRVNNSHLIHHTHFSVCQSISRRLPRFVAWNIDGGQFKSLSRNGLDFKFDPQVHEDFQAGDSLYKNNDYDRGHIARRADLVWGSTAEAKRANRESFFFTNITPQHKRFNQSGLAGLWGELENAIFADVDVHDLRISVFAGPIFKLDDPVYRGVQIPREFWKLIAFQDAADGRFKVAAYILTQRDLVFTEALELDAFQLHQVSLTELFDETGLDFRHLVGHDTFGEGIAQMSALGAETELVAERLGRLPTQRREIGSREQLLSWKPRAAAATEAPARATEQTAVPFDLSSLANTGFSWQTALALAHCCKLAYEAPATVRLTAISNWGFQAAQFIEVGDTQCFVATTPSAIVVSFRGTHNVPDWITNLTLFSTARPYGNVHRGFAQAFDLVKTAIGAQLVASGVGTRKLLLTGHSLGGALATIAAAELKSEFQVDGIYTYGQPRPGKADFQQFIAQNYSDCFHRIVNDDDIVPRVPPGYEHVGKLYHLDADGSLLESMVEAAVGDAEPAPLTEPEFRALQESLRASQLAARASLEMVDEREVVLATAEGLFPESITTEGVFPSFSDHKIKRYIAKISRLATGESADETVGGEDFVGGVVGAEEGLEATIPTSPAKVFKVRSIQQWERDRKIDPLLETMHDAALLSAGPNAYEAMAAPAAEGIAEAAEVRGPQGVPVVLRLRTEKWIAPAGMTIHSRIGNFATAHCTPLQLEMLRNDPGVLAVEASRDAGLPEVAISVPFIGATDVHRPPTSETGTGAIVGLIDSGIDILHEAFLDAAGQSRILAIWNQRETATPGSDYKSPKNTLPGAFTQDYGVLYLNHHIQALISSNSSADIPRMLRDPGPGGGPGHGTHVASIAAGRTAGEFAGGVAPDARIMAVIPNMVTSEGDPPSLGYSNSHVDAMSFLIAAAKAPEVGKGFPIAINVSLGMNAGAHDGLSLLEASFDAATNNGRSKGVVIVKSAGNEGDSGGHAELQAFGGMQRISWNSSRTPRQRDYIEVWYSSLHELEFTLIDPAGAPSPTVSAANPTAVALLGGNRCTLQLTLFHPDGGDHRLQISISPQTAGISPGIWHLEVNGVAVVGGNPSIHAWAERDAARAIRFLTGDNSAMTLSIPGTAKHVIAVTASGAGLPLKLTPSSSQGLTRDGRPKPDLCAPGTAVRAAASNTGNRTAVTVMSGTSMAAPHVTGAVALAFSLRNRLGKQQLTANQVAGMLRKYSVGGNGNHNRSFGFGCLAAQAFINAVSNLPAGGANSPPPTSPTPAAPPPPA